MQLILIKGWDGDKELISNQPDENVIDEVVKSLDWHQFNSVTLEIDEKNWLNISGNISEDGLAIVDSKHGEFIVSDTAPETVEELITILQSYLFGDQQYKKYGFSSTKELALKQKLRENKIRREVYEIQKKEDRRKYIFNLAVSIIFISVLSITLYLWYIDELKFIGHQTDFTTASVIETKMKPVKGGLIQIVIYEFEWHGTKYKGHFDGSKKTGKHEVNDLIRVKYSTEDPRISKRVATLKRKY